MTIMSKIHLFLAACAAALACSIGASEAHAQTCPWGAPSPVVTVAGSYESNFANCGGQSGGNTAAARVWINSGFGSASVRRSLICSTMNNVGILVAGQFRDFFSGVNTTRYRRGAAPTCDTSYTVPGSLTEFITKAACQIGFGSGCLTVKSGI